MGISKKFLLLMVVLFFISISAISAADDNSTVLDSPLNDSDCSYGTEIIQEDILANSSSNHDVVKTNPKISVKSTKVKSKDTLDVNLKNSKGNPLKNKKLTALINNKKYSIKTNSKGIAHLKINLPAKYYKLKISFAGDKTYNSFSKTFKIKVSKIETKILPLNNFVVKKGNLYFYLYEKYWNSIHGKKLTFRLNGKSFTKSTNRHGYAKLKIKLPTSKYTIYAKFKGNEYYKPSFKELKFHVVEHTSFSIENSKLLTKGFLRVYYKNSAGSIGGKPVVLKIANKKFTKKTNSEGFVLFKPKVDAKAYGVKVTLGKFTITKKLICYEGNVKDPLKENISLKKGAPDIDVMPWNYVTGDGNAKYTLTKAQYKEVLKRDSYCLFLNGKLPKYTFFKTKSHPKLNHIIKREKWNVIEREINKKMISANRHNYWPSKISVSLKGKSYTYSEVRDVQNTGYTCGPTSASVCSQVLRNYVCESYLSKLAGTNSREGTTCGGIKYSLEKNNFYCTYYYKASFKNALNQLKEGGCALIFHADKHYVAILDISKDGKKVLVSNSYGSYDNIPTKWLKVSYMKTKFSHWEESLVVKLNYKLSKKTQNEVNCFYNSMGTNWKRHNTHQSIGSV